MNITVFSTKPYDRTFLESANGTYRHTITYYEPHLDRQTASLAKGSSAVCVFVNDTLDRTTIEALASGGTSIIALRCAGFNNVDLEAAAEFGMTVVRVPAYSPYAVAEHAVALILTLNRKIHRAHNRVRESNFALDGLMGFDLNGSTVGVIGTGHIGRVFCGIMKGFGCTVLALDPYPNEDCRSIGVRYVELSEIYRSADIISLHCPLTPQTHHMIDAAAIRSMKDSVMIINTSRGALVDTAALIEALKNGKVGHVGLDVYEEEGDLFFEDLSNKVVQDDVFARLTTFPNVIVTGHQAFFTRQALGNIADTTLGNIALLEKGASCPNTVTAAAVRK